MIVHIQGLPHIYSPAGPSNSYSAATSDTSPVLPKLLTFLSYSSNLATPRSSSQSGSHSRSQSQEPSQHSKDPQLSRQQGRSSLGGQQPPPGAPHSQGPPEKMKQQDISTILLKLSYHIIQLYLSQKVNFISILNPRLI